MGIITIEKVDYLLWLGRYTERVYTTVQLFENDYDNMIDNFEYSYKEFCERLQIPDIYTSKEDFIERYAYDAGNPDSIVSNLTRAYDNAIYMRDEIGSQTLSYIQMAIYDIQAAHKSSAPMIRIQKIIDNLLAFWGCIYDHIDDDKIRSIIKLGKRIERLDLYLRFHESASVLKKEMNRLTYRLAKTGLPYSADEADLLYTNINSGGDIDYKQAIKHLEAIFNV